MKRKLLSAKDIEWYADENPLYDNGMRGDASRWLNAKLWPTMDHRIAFRPFSWLELSAVRSLTLREPLIAGPAERLGPELGDDA